MKILEVKNVEKSYESKKIIEDISIDLRKGEIISLLGLSGVGKTTLFNIISGVESPDSGEVILKGEEITAKPGHISYMLQKDLLIEQKTILDNIILPLRIKGVKKNIAVKKANEYLEMFGLLGYEKSYPNSLSGGMRQRAAFLRTYFASEEVVLLDEPFSALDAITKKEMHKWYKEISQRLNLSTIFITHDIDEALEMSDRIYLMIGSPGKIENEIVIKSSEGDFTLTKEFLEYKKEILHLLGLR
ncbi:ABC-type nitrate/sulfonate/bicarbonate transport system, ATPase component [Peptoniphilus asaccharolyticus DSM 20463]|uniref:ABC-type nitrate/sulfonate/bicarbonate transport system, ATPase component n=1 Tax=Peptoniphilus asaccharolyticus DSM 20463 TaxID=573058 RepID=A0A1W1VEC5_PEPAS|nr:ABC transporter ATP-binding protein [Peptoniphilus asaccharolyticus]MBL7574560.1 ABC transporter ATP-binding protein [Peptoniphilus asaccharolyticus]CRH93296.1 ABC transporter ATP-binding protein [Chlamydia trachomatis]SMB91411.1 ABC-type nitrate/sulfonate/bicarbonate transport system, ATPase component [Peptoniphilus asaccharolyticus DSM 20463]